MKFTKKHSLSAGPLLAFNINGNEAYLCAFKDSKKRVVKCAMISRDLRKVAVADNADDAVSEYISVRDTNPALDYSTDGTISEVLEVKVEHDTVYIFYLKGKDDAFVSCFDKPKKGRKAVVMYNVVDNTNMVRDISFIK